MDFFQVLFPHLLTSNLEFASACTKQFKVWEELKDIRRLGFMSRICNNSTFIPSRSSARSNVAMYRNSFIQFIGDNDFIAYGVQKTERDH